MKVKEFKSKRIGQIDFTQNWDSQRKLKKIAYTTKQL